MLDLETPATEIEIAELLDGLSRIATGAVARRWCLTIRRLAFERDQWRRARTRIARSAVSAASSIVDNLDDWDGEAQQAAQVAQNVEAWRHVMLDHVAARIVREFTSPTQEARRDT